jgi:hypothetical protein
MKGRHSIKIAYKKETHGVIILQHRQPGSHNNNLMYAGEQKFHVWCNTEADTYIITSFSFKSQIFFNSAIVSFPAPTILLSLWSHASHTGLDNEEMPRNGFCNHLH